VVGGGAVLDLIEEWSLGKAADYVHYKPLLTALVKLFNHTGGPTAPAFPPPYGSTTSVSLNSHTAGYQRLAESCAHPHTSHPKPTSSHRHAVAGFSVLGVRPALAEHSGC